MTEYAVADAGTTNGIHTIRICGEIDLTNTTAVREAISHLASPDAPTILIDLTKTTYLDSSGIAMLFHLSQRLTERRQTLRLVVPPDSPLRTALDLTHLPQTIPIQAV